MTGTRTITLTVPATWHVELDDDGNPQPMAWTSRGHMFLMSEWPGRFGALLHRALVTALPRMQWAVLSPAGDEIYRVSSEAQAVIFAVVRSVGESDPAVVVRRIDDDTDWSDDCGLTYMHGPDDVVPDDLLADPGDAAVWLGSAAALGRRAPDHGWVHAALRREATAHGHDITALEG